MSAEEGHDLAEGAGDRSSSSSFEDLASASDLAEAQHAAQVLNSPPSAEEPEWQDVLGSGKLFKKEVVKGDESDGLRPQRGDVCRITYEVKLKDSGEIIEKREGIKIYLGDNEILQGLDLALSLMYRNETSLLNLSPRFGYGEAGLKPGDPLGCVVDPLEVKYEGPAVGAEAWLEASLTLHDWTEEPEHETLSIAERMDLGSRRRVRGNWWYARGEPTTAVQLYRRALDVLDESQGGISDPTPDGGRPPASADLLALLQERVRVHNNLAAAQLRAGAYEAALQAVNHVLSCEPDNAKALYRRACILTAQGDAAGAVTAARAAAVAAPDDAAVRRELARAEARAGRDREAEKRLAKRMLGTRLPPPKPDKKPGSRKMLVWGSLLLSLLVGAAGVLLYRYRNHSH